MSKARAQGQRIIILGFMTGFLLTGLAGFITYNFYTNSKKLSRFNAVPLTKKFSKDGYRLFVATSLDRIFQDGQTLVKPVFDSAAKLSSARNEYESFQVVLQADDKHLYDVGLDIPDLLNSQSGSKIDAVNITWRIVGYVPTKEPYYPVKYIGPWPDPLLPGKEIDIAPQTTQPFWVTVYVPKETPAGNYSGTIQVRISGQSPQLIPVSLEVYDFTLPQENRLKTAFDFYGHHTKDRYPQGKNESTDAHAARINSLNEKYLLEMLRYRLNPILNIDPASEWDLGRVDKYRIYGLNNFSIGRRGGTFGNNWPEDDGALDGLLPLYRSYAETLRLNKMLQYTYIYTWDEGKLGNPRVAKISAMIHRAHPALKNMVCYHGFWDPQKHPGWGNEIDIWCFQIDKFVEEKMRALQELGKEIWVYISGPSGFTTPNLAIDFDSMDYRIIPWLCWKYDLKGVLYWCVNWWPFVNPFKSAANSKWEQNGNGLLFYPGTDGPWASLRLEIFRDGMEDYEYIQTLLEKIKQIKRLRLDTENPQIVTESIQLMTVDPAIAESMFKFTKNTMALLERRKLIAKKIEEVDRILKNQLNMPLAATNNEK